MQAMISRARPSVEFLDRSDREELCSLDFSFSSFLRVFSMPTLIRTETLVIRQTISIHLFFFSTCKLNLFFGFVVLEEHVKSDSQKRRKRTKARKFSAASFVIASSCQKNGLHDKKPLGGSRNQSSQSYVHADNPHLIGTDLDKRQGQIDTSTESFQRIRTCLPPLVVGFLRRILVLVCVPTIVDGNDQGRSPPLPG